jgi:hypothetical protein
MAALAPHPHGLSLSAGSFINFAEHEPESANRALHALGIESMDSQRLVELAQHDLHSRFQVRADGKTWHSTAPGVTDQEATRFKEEIGPRLAAIAKTPDVWPALGDYFDHLRSGAIRTIEWASSPWRRIAFKTMLHLGGSSALGALLSMGVGFGELQALGTPRAELKRRLEAIRGAPLNPS